MDPILDPTLVLAPAALRFLALALLETADGGRIVSGGGDDDALDIIAMLHNLGLLEVAPGGWQATEFLLRQPWAPLLAAEPMMVVYDD
jgi:hypothetical protein